MATKKSTNTHGGQRKNAGPPRQNMHLDMETAKELRLLTRHRRAILGKPELTEEDIVTYLVRREWDKIDEAYQRAAEIVARAEEPFIL